MGWKKLYKHQPEAITRAEGAAILWSFVIQTDRKIKSNRPDIVVKSYERKIYLPNDMAAPTDNNISVKDYNKISKYQSSGNRN